MVTFIARRFPITGRQVTHGGFAQRKFARLRIAVPTRGAIPARSLTALRRIGAWATFRAVTPRGRLGHNFFRRFGGWGAF